MGQFVEKRTMLVLLGFKRLQIHPGNHKDDRRGVQDLTAIHPCTGAEAEYVHQSGRASARCRAIPPTP